MPQFSRDWITAEEAARLMTANTDHEISAAYVRLLAKKGKIASRPINGRENEYMKSSAAGYKVRPKHTPRVRPIETRKSYMSAKKTPETEDEQLLIGA